MTTFSDTGSLGHGADGAATDGEEAAHIRSLAVSFARRLQPKHAPHVPFTVEVDVVTELDAHGVQLSVSAAHVEDTEPGAPDLVVSWERLEDMEAVEQGQTLLMSMLRLGRASVRADDPDFLRLITTIRSAPDDPRPVPDLLADLPGWIVGRSDRAIAKMVRSIGLEVMLHSYARTHVEALSMSDIVMEMPTFCLMFSVVDDKVEHAVEIGLENGVPFLRPVAAADSAADASMRWLSPVAFGRYNGRLLDFRDAILNGDCVLAGDRSLGAAVYGRIGRHGL